MKCPKCSEDMYLYGDVIYKNKPIIELSKDNFILDCEVAETDMMYKSYDEIKNTHWECFDCEYKIKYKDV